MADLLEIAEYAEVTPIGWAQLNAAGQTLVESDAYIHLLDAKYEHYYAVMRQLDIPELTFRMQPGAAQEAYEAVAAEIEARGDAILAALRAGQPTVAANLAVRMPKDALRRFLVAVNTICFASYVGHQTGVWRDAVLTGRMSLSDAEANADDTYRMWDAVLQLNRQGILETYKKPEFRGGLGGAPPMLVIVLVIGVVLVVALIAFLIVFLKQVSFQQQVIEDSCFDKGPTGRLVLKKPLPPHCDAYLKGITKDPNSGLNLFLKPFEQASKAAATVLSFAVVLGGAYLAATYGPAIVAAFKRRRKSGPGSAAAGWPT